MTVEPARSALLPDHLLDLEEWGALPEDPSRRFELAEGVLVISPRPTLRHQEMVSVVLGQCRSAAGGRWRALPDVEVEIDDGPPPTVRVPDVVLLRPSVTLDRRRIGRSDVLAVVEVHSPGTRRLDRVLKAHEYASAGVPTYLLVETGPPAVLTELRLDGGAYVTVAEHVGSARLELGVVVDLAQHD